MPIEQSAGKPTARRYSDQEKAAAVRMVRSLRAELGTEHGTVHRVAKQLGYGVESVRLWVERICSVLQVAPSTYYARNARPPSARQVRDAVLRPELVTLWEANYRVYGARKLWKAAGRAGLDVGRDQVARLMRSAGIEGVSRTKRVRTTRCDPLAARHPDLVGRDFTATAPNQLWVTDLTYVPTWAGVAYVCFIIDAYSRLIVGWRAAPTMRTQTVLDAIEMARWSRGTNLAGLRCHSDAGSQFTSLRYGERLAEIGATPSIGTVGDSYDNALAETVNGYYKAELIRGPARQRPWKSVEDVELATLGWVHWHNHQRLHGYLGDIPPAEFEQAFYADHTDRHQAESNSATLHKTQGGSIIILAGVAATVLTQIAKRPGWTAARSQAAALAVSVVLGVVAYVVSGMATVFPESIVDVVSTAVVVIAGVALMSRAAYTLLGRAVPDGRETLTAEQAPDGADEVPVHGRRADRDGVPDGRDTPLEER